MLDTHIHAVGYITHLKVKTDILLNGLASMYYISKYYSKKKMPDDIKDGF